MSDWPRYLRTPSEMTEVWQLSENQYCIVVIEPAATGFDGLATYRGVAYRCNRLGDVRGLTGELKAGTSQIERQRLTGPFDVRRTADVLASIELPPVEE